MTALAHDAPLATATVCGACGAALERSQEYCLECGSRLADRRGPAAALGRAWQARFGRYPGDWIWLSLLALGVAAAGIAAAIAITDGGGGQRGETIVATDTPRLASSPVTTASPQATATAELPTAPPPTTPTKPALLKGWPVPTGHTVILASIPARGPGRTEARSKGKAALEAGLDDVGILVSDNFASLHPGYYVVFAGVFESLEEAQTSARRIASRYPSAYAREITR